MNSEVSRPLTWSTQLDVLPQAETPPLKGDRIILPQSALEQLLAAATTITSNDARPETLSFDPFNPYTFPAERQVRKYLFERQQNLPHPLTFRLVNPEKGNVLYAGIREFSAPDGKVGLSTFIRQALGLVKRGGERTESKLTVHVEILPKGQFVKLRPLEAGYDVDWKAFLEQHLRDTYVTLTAGEEITISAGREDFRFLVDQLRPSGNAISIIDTDLEVDIEPLSEEQARETLRILAKKTQRGIETREGSSFGGKITVNSSESGQVLPFEYVDYDVKGWAHQQNLEIELIRSGTEGDLDLFVAPFGPRQRMKPREEIYTLANLDSQAAKKVIVRQSNVAFEDAEDLWISVRAWSSKNEDAEVAVPVQYELRVSQSDTSSDKHNIDVSGEDPMGHDEERCSNCQQRIPKRTMFLHENFCLRNNILCPKCQNVYQKSSEEWSSHWHCPHDRSFGDTIASQAKHETLLHATRICSACDYEAANTPDLAFHRTTHCPAKLILCQFCHLQVPQQGPEDPDRESAEVLLSGLTPHEVSDGARTTECHLCAKIVRLRDMTTHLKHHDFQRLSRSIPRICINANCGRTVDSVSRLGEVKYRSLNEMSLCEPCFGPLYVSQYDPEGKALRRRLERKYLTQLLTGCNQSWCKNEFCKTGRKHLGYDVEATVTSKGALAMIRPLLDGLRESHIPVHLCTDEASQTRRTMAEMVAAEGTASTKGKGKETDAPQGGYQLEWCVAALEVEQGNLDRARTWLQGFAPRRDEVRK